MLTPDPWTPPGVYTPTLTVYLAGEGEATVTLAPVTIAPAVESPVLPESLAGVEAVGGAVGDRPQQEAPLRLVGLWLGRDAVHPCETVDGWLHWESTVELAGGFSVAATLAEQRLDLPVVAESADRTLAAGTRFATQFHLPVGCKALDAQAQLEVSLLDATGSSLAAWRGPRVMMIADRTFVPPAGILDASGDFGPGFAELLGYTAAPELRAGTPFTVTLYWRAGETGDAPYTVFVHVTPPDAPAPLVAQHDGWPVLGAKPTYTWVAGEIIADAHPLPGIPAGTYHLRVGLYDGVGRLEVHTADTALREDAVVIPLIVIP